MAKLNTYNIPIDLIKKTGMKIQAVSQEEAINKALNFIEKTNFNDFKIHHSDITCEQDDEMMEEIAKDFNLDIKDYETRDTMTHTVFPWSGSKVENN